MGGGDAAVRVGLLDDRPDNLKRGDRPRRRRAGLVPSLEVVRAIVEEAHAHGRIAAAHLSGPEGAQLALDAGVDEWAHVPCDPISPELIASAAAAGVRVVSTLDTLSHCTGVAGNASQLIA